jgi:inositol oxygenase
VPDYLRRCNSHSVHVATTTEKQTVAFNIQARVNFKSRRRARMGIWGAMEMLNTLVDESDPDVSLRRCRSHVNAATDAAFWGTD